MVLIMCIPFLLWSSCLSCLPQAPTCCTEQTGRSFRPRPSGPTPQSRPLLPSSCKQMAIVLSGGVYHWRCREGRGWGAGHNAWEQRPSRPESLPAPCVGWAGPAPCIQGNLTRDENVINLQAHAHHEIIDG